jgi:hypothetical protein
MSDRDRKTGKNSLNKVKGFGASLIRIFEDVETGLVGGVK